MDDSERMRLGQRAGDLRSIAGREFWRKRAFLDLRGERGAFDELHHQVVRANIVERANVRMVQRGNRPSFELKSLAIAFGGNLDGDYAAQSGIDGAIYGAHATGADLGFDFIWTELGARRNTVWVGSAKKPAVGWSRMLAAGF